MVNNKLDITDIIIIYYTLVCLVIRKIEKMRQIDEV